MRATGLFLVLLL